MATPRKGKVRYANQQPQPQAKVFKFTRYEHLATVKEKEKPDMDIEILRSVSKSLEELTKKVDDLEKTMNTSLHEQRENVVQYLDEMRTEILDKLEDLDG